jgi:hypothetical protein
MLSRSGSGQWRCRDEDIISTASTRKRRMTDTSYPATMARRTN